MNMWPDALVAIRRSAYGTIMWHYFDDFGILNPDRMGTEPQDALNEPIDWMGRRLHEEKEHRLRT